MRKFHEEKSSTEGEMCMLKIEGVDFFAAPVYNTVLLSVLQVHGKKITNYKRLQIKSLFRKLYLISSDMTSKLFKIKSLFRILRSL